MQVSDTIINQPQEKLLTDAALMQSLKDAIAQKLAPDVTNIDLKGIYPEEFLRDIGSLGAYGQGVSTEYGGT